MELKNGQIKSLIDAIYKISAGDIAGPRGIEALSMAIAGDGLDNPLSKSIEKGAQLIADSINNLAEAIREIK
jgi:hypothetical protein